MDPPRSMKQGRVRTPWVPWRKGCGASPGCAALTRAASASSLRRLWWSTHSQNHSCLRLPIKGYSRFLHRKVRCRWPCAPRSPMGQGRLVLLSRLRGGRAQGLTRATLAPIFLRASEFTECAGNSGFNNTHHDRRFCYFCPSRNPGCRFASVSLPGHHAPAPWCLALAAASPLRGRGDCGLGAAGQF